MKALGPIAATLLLYGLMQVAFADNGVERGSIDFGSSSPIPEKLQSQLQVLLFDNCELQDATRIEPASVRVSRDSEFSSSPVTHYEMQFTVFFRNRGSSQIQVDAELRQRPTPSIRIARFSSPICRSPR